MDRETYEQSMNQLAAQARKLEQVYHEGVRETASVGKQAQPIRGDFGNAGNAVPMPMGGPPSYSPSMSGGSGLNPNAGASRISCVELLRSRSNELRRKADSLDQLADMIFPNLASLNSAADNALWTLIAQIQVY